MMHRTILKTDNLKSIFTDDQLITFTDQQTSVDSCACQAHAAFPVTKQQSRCQVRSE